MDTHAYSVDTHAIDSVDTHSIPPPTEALPAPLYLQVMPDASPGTGVFATIQAAIDSLPADNGSATQRWAIIRIAPGLYREKLFLKRDKVVLAGSGLERSILQYPELRRHFLRRQAAEIPAALRSSSQPAQDISRQHQPQHLPRGAALTNDWGAAVVNIDARDIVLLDLTVHNSYVLENPTDPDRFDHQFALRGFTNASRIITDQTRLATNGGDTVSLWNKQDGLYYHSRSFFSGRVDLLCPRGTALVVDSDFVNHKATATLWHDGELSAAQQLVVLRSHFHGVTGFELGRRHYDGQFALLGNTFSAALADRPIYRVTYPAEPARDQPNRWGDRNWFAANQPLYPWLADTLPPAGPLNQLLSASEPGAVVFDGDWYPERTLAQIRRWLKPAAPD